VSAEIPEGTVAQGLADIQKANPDVTIGSYPFYSERGPGAQLVTRGRDAQAVERAASAIEALVRQLGGTPVRV
jgi:molybdopterin-biosynthesis enzyme MoeA-like protein